jgi:hypothetical protein
LTPLAAVLAALLAGCIPYPVHKTLQPAAAAMVQDLNRRPLANAKVTLISTAYPYGREKTRETSLTGADGLASFPLRKEWRVEVLMIHGAEAYAWNWCIEKEGFATQESAQRSAHAFAETNVFTLLEGVSTACERLSR